MTIKIVHVSDLHLGKGVKTGLNIKKDLREKALEKVLREEPDAFVVSGDLVKYACEADFEVALDFIRELEERAPTLCIPGNIDYNYSIFYTKKEGEGEEEKVRIIEGFKVKKITTFDREIDIQDMQRFPFRSLPYYIQISDKYYGFIECVDDVNYLEKASLDSYLRTLGDDEPLLRIGDVNLIGIDSTRDVRKLIVGSVETDDPYQEVYLTERMDGRINKSHVEKTLRNLNPGLNILVAHHPIFHIPGSNGKYGNFYNGEETGRTLIENGVQLSLCGHKHIPGFVEKEIQLDSGRKVPFYVSAAGTLLNREIKKPYQNNSYDLLTIDGNRVVIDYKEIQSDRSDQVADIKLED